MMKKIQILLVLLLTSGSMVFAQDKPDRLVTKANAKYEEYSFRPAIDIYKRVIDRGYTSADLLKKLGNAYYFNADYEEAANTYKRLVKEYPDDVAPEYYFRYAQTLKTLQEYESSNEVMAMFTNATSDDLRASTYKEERDYLSEIKKNSGRYNVAPFNYNSPYSDFAPTFYKEGLIFSSDRDTGNFARYRHTWNSKDFLDLYKVNADSASNNLVVKLGDHVNTRLHESTSTTDKNGTVLYFTRNNYKEGKYVKDGKGIVRLKIYRATKNEEGLWSNIEALPFNSDDYSVAHPTLSNDGSTLYFASDMPGSLGESDIFKVQVNDDGSFGEPENLGSTINTEARETFPFITSEDILYFSSDGHPGLGGLDIFAANVSDGRSDGVVMNIGEPVNGRMDDFTFIFDESTRKGYFASNRSEGLGADDIYSFLETKALVLDCRQTVSGTVRDKISNEVLVGATVKVIDEDNNEIMTSITDADGKYTLELDCDQGNFVRAMTEGYIPAEEYLGKSDGTPKTINFFLERNTVSAGFGDDLAKLLQLSTIYFDFDKYNIRKDSEIEVEKVIAAMEKYPSLKIQVNSHTDSRGKDSYNLWLSQKRAESTVNYMIKKGIAKERLQSEGYGETKLLNNCDDGVSCTEEEHQLNRRSEFIITE
ncbi:MAG: flagellar motor protein MotB [Pseudozobellia sp.]|nr:flagellar motor protein MotB [Pseudozobellia sp.]|tara:strand:- start:1296 stop:3245 length:1950 start_codon:yes stop_codon:yes gene_type:complete